jgi:hypothetical protein
LIVTQWHLEELWDYTTMQLGNAFGFTPELPSFHAIYIPPQRPHGDVSVHPGYLPDDPPYDQEHEYWFMGQYWYWDELSGQYFISNSPYHWSSSYDGTDLGLGMNVKLNGQYWFYMGDTWDEKYLEYPDHHTAVPMWSDADCTPPARCDDMIVVSSDSDPRNGIDAVTV